MAKYKTVRNGKEYVYDYDRKRFYNNTPEFNREYYQKNKDTILRNRARQRLMKQIEERLPMVSIKGIKGQ